MDVVIPAKALTLATIAKPVSAHLFPIGTVLVGGFLGWKFWQQQNKLKQVEKQQAELSQQIEQLHKQQQETAEIITPKINIISPKKENISKPNENSLKQGLFEQIIHDNIELRQTISDGKTHD